MESMNSPFLKAAALATCGVMRTLNKKFLKSEHPSITHQIIVIFMQLDSLFKIQKDCLELVPES